MMRPDTDDGALLAVRVATLFVLTDSRRILLDNAPDRSAGPRFYLAGCESGNIVRIRHDVGDETARAIEQLAANEPPLHMPDSTPVHLDDYIRLVATEAPVERYNPGLTWRFPEGLNYAHDVPLVGSETPEGDRLLADLADRGMPQPLTAHGFRAPSHFWPPWCVTLHDGEIASIAFAARLGPGAAETGVVTVPHFEAEAWSRRVTPGMRAANL